MLSLSEIHDILTRAGLKLSGPPVQKDGDNSEVYVFVVISKDANGHQKPSNSLLRKLESDLIELGVSAHFVLNEVTHFDFEAGLRATLLHAFPELVRNSFLTIHRNDAVVWIVPKSTQIREHMSDITSRVSVFLVNAGLSLGEIKLTIDEKLPTRTAILSELRISAPASVDTLVDRLTAKGFVKPPADYVTRHLDALRRSNLVIRRTDALYCLTASALKVLGTVKRRNSPDVVRFLDLAGRGDLQ